METERDYWVSCLGRVAEPVLAAMAAGALRERMPLEAWEDVPCGRLETARLEVAGRLLCGLSPWLEARGLVGEEAALRDRYAEMARVGIAHGVDAEHADYWNFDGSMQAIVDAAFFASALLRAPGALWDPLKPEVRERIIDRFRLLRGKAPFYNNWILFGAMPEVLLARVGGGWDPMRVDYAIRQMEQWYVGDGQYADGPMYHFDYYNSIVIQPLLLEVLEEAVRHEERWNGYLEPVRRRLGRTAAIYERLIQVDGSWPVVGRSLAYRTGVFHVLSFAAWKGYLPEELAPAQVRCALTAALRRGLAGDGNYDAAGWLVIGLNGRQPGLGESYVTTASCYLASFVFAPLGLSPSDPFWADGSLPWTARRVWEMGEDVSADHSLPADRKVQ